MRIFIEQDSTKIVNHTRAPVFPTFERQQHENGCPAWFLVRMSSVCFRHGDRPEETIITQSATACYFSTRKQPQFFILGGMMMNIHINFSVDLYLHWSHMSRPLGNKTKNLQNWLFWQEKGIKQVVQVICTQSLGQKIVLIHITGYLVCIIEGMGVCGVSWRVNCGCKIQNSITFQHQVHGSGSDAHAISC